eukprot:scaffold3256_cov444-Prasinococcus_capsulatus_cf.AAC.4
MPPAALAARAKTPGHSPYPTRMLKAPERDRDECCCRRPRTDASSPCLTRILHARDSASGRHRAFAAAASAYGRPGPHAVPCRRRRGAATPSPLLRTASAAVA